MRMMKKMIRIIWLFGEWLWDHNSFNARVVLKQIFKQIIINLIRIPYLII